MLQLQELQNFLKIEKDRVKVMVNLMKNTEKVTVHYSRVSHIRNYFISVTSKSVSYVMTLVSRECFSFLFEELSSVLGLNRFVLKMWTKCCLNHQETINLI